MLASAPPQGKTSSGAPLNTDLEYNMNLRSTSLAIAVAIAALALPGLVHAQSAGTETGKVAWYGKKFAGRTTASGERYNPDALTMAHNTLPFGTKVKVTNLDNKKSVVLRVNDRGPKDGSRLGDVSQAGAKRLGMTKAGVVDAQLQVVARK
jgi:rare lipoprotein A